MTAMPLRPQPGLESLLFALAEGGLPQGNQSQAMLPLLGGLGPQQEVIQTLSPDLLSLLSSLGALQAGAGQPPVLPGGAPLLPVGGI